MDCMAAPAGCCLGRGRGINRLDLPTHSSENWLREQGGEASYRSDFIAEHLLPLLYPVELTRDLQLL